MYEDRPPVDQEIKLLREMAARLERELRDVELRVRRLEKIRELRLRRQQSNGASQGEAS